jgi:hypothetical protein
MEIKANTVAPAIFRIELLHALLVAALCALLLPLKLVEFPALLVGALFIGVNFLLLSCGIRWVLTPFASKGRIKAGIALLALKLLLFLALVSILFLRVRLDPLSFALGFSSLLVAAIFERVWASVKGD